MGSTQPDLGTSTEEARTLASSEQNSLRLHALAGDQKGTRIMQIMQRLT